MSCMARDHLDSRTRPARAAAPDWEEPADGAREASAVTLFSSARERRLWAWTLAIVVAIYTTLGLARTLAGALRDQDLQAAVFVFGALLVATAVFALARKVRPGGAEIGVALGVVAVYLLVFVRMTSPVERSHLIEYGVVAVFVYEALKERSSHGRRVLAPAWLAIAVTALFGAVDESIQVFLPSRVFDPQDIYFNTLAAAMAIAASVMLGRARRRDRLRSP